MLRHFLPALCWAVVLGIATSSLYDHWLAKFTGKRRHTWAALTFTSLIGIILIAPIVFRALVALREAISLAPTFAAAHRPPPPPHGVLERPGGGDWLQKPARARSR